MLSTPRDRCFQYSRTSGDHGHDDRLCHVDDEAVTVLGCRHDKTSDKQFRSLDINLNEVRGIPIGEVIIKAFCVDDDCFLAHGAGIGPFA
jgi:hypothetical protein